MSKCKHVMGIKSTYRPVSPSNEQVFKDDGILEDCKSHFPFLELDRIQIISSTSFTEAARLQFDYFSSINNHEKGSLDLEIY